MGRTTRRYRAVRSHGSQYPGNGADHGAGERLELLLELGQRSDVPAAAERLHQQHAGVDAATEDVDLSALIRERHGLSRDDLQAAVDPSPVAIGEQPRRELRRFHGAPLLLGLLLENAESAPTDHRRLDAFRTFPNELPSKPTEAFRITVG